MVFPVIQTLVMRAQVGSPAVIATNHQTFQYFYSRNAFCCAFELSDSKTCSYKRFQGLSVRSVFQLSIASCFMYIQTMRSRLQFQHLSTQFLSQHHPQSQLHIPFSWTSIRSSTHLGKNGELKCKELATANILLVVLSTYCIVPVCATCVTFLLLPSLFSV